MIRIELKGEMASAKGMHHESVCGLCRKLVQAGFNPALPAEAWRGQTLSLRISSIGKAAALQAQADRPGGGFARYSGPKGTEQERGTCDSSSGAG